LILIWRRSFKWKWMILIFFRFCYTEFEWEGEYRSEKYVTCVGKAQLGRGRSPRGHTRAALCKETEDLRRKCYCWGCGSSLRGRGSHTRNYHTSGSHYYSTSCSLNIIRRNIIQQKFKKKEKKLRKKWEKRRNFQFLSTIFEVMRVLRLRLRPTWFWLRAWQIKWLMPRPLKTRVRPQFILYFLRIIILMALHSNMYLFSLQEL